MRHNICFTVNGTRYENWVESRRTLLQVIREDLRLTGTKKGCEKGECGACSVIMNGKLVNSCLVLAVEADGKDIQTIEGLRKGQTLHPLQNSFIAQGALQCGYCTPGMIMSAKALLDENPNPTEDEVKKAIEGNLCRCTGYVKIIKAIMAVARRDFSCLIFLI
jgi:aerobic-type carbon monoxide dehydrogenase small subunit (CoxS/CutS family)